MRIGRGSLEAPGRLAHWVRGALSPDERRLAVALNGERVPVATWRAATGR